MNSCRSTLSSTQPNAQLPKRQTLCSRAVSLVSTRLTRRTPQSRPVTPQNLHRTHGRGLRGRAKHSDTRVQDITQRRSEVRQRVRADASPETGRPWEPRACVRLPHPSSFHRNDHESRRLYPPLSSRGLHRSNA
ncbi:hypothetical protein PsYK624_151460 [Phanerochaete sordida]|uniref:Uncharacterized protein n=1 Tax=Phanerochaete sordida TaxID=48140 RepID=A0A9P3GRA6_9APHY|nr:hypothetical protein PsYK624_151460 [Phanerochaete sordida]